MASARTLGAGTPQPQRVTPALPSGPHLAYPPRPSRAFCPCFIRSLRTPDEGPPTRGRTPTHCYRPVSDTMHNRPVRPPPPRFHADNLPSRLPKHTHTCTAHLQVILPNERAVVEAQLHPGGCQQAAEARQVGQVPAHHAPRRAVLHLDHHRPTVGQRRAVDLSRARVG